MILTLLPREKWNPQDTLAPVGTPECRAYTTAEVEALLAASGLTQIHVVANPDPRHPSNCCVVGHKP